MTIANGSLLKVEALGRQIQNRWIWRNISFELQPGERLALIGSSGAGKSLLLRSLAGLDPAQTGKICFRDQPLSDWLMPHYRAQVTYVQQRPALFEGTVEDNLRSVYQFAVHHPKTFDRDRIAQYLALLNRPTQFLDRPSLSLSGGEAQIVGFLRALQLNPQVFLLDEPTAALDREAVEQFEALVRCWHTEDPQRAYIWTSHNPDQVQRISDRQFALSPDESTVKPEA
ncbi:MAG: ATP-binding cassette domain-containing protein [Elainella sp. Prado103]|jgi:putative ABC transport system ATP-binding protein|nr:ATP-binding cassette domain-containing protein [Elainella sp. Prado103]